eukprot:TRINITY_DN624_c0_g1_i13.p1 TRINITY_DN624_c0_g1~~TRINITY_DN624_c0_g1_i13.p1  ORF type:complete len:634 (+),score=80.78 TRINITY_DN624_c0_g1_i13:1349-3250(+)
MLPKQDLEKLKQLNEQKKISLNQSKSLMKQAVEKTMMEKKKNSLINWLNQGRLSNKNQDTQAQQNSQFRIEMQNKLKTADFIYELLIKMCKNNTDNEIIAFQYLHYIQFQVKFIPKAIDFVISLIVTNENNLKEIGQSLAQFSVESLQKVISLIEQNLLLDSQKVNQSKDLVGIAQGLQKLLDYRKKKKKLHLELKRQDTYNRPSYELDTVQNDKDNSLSQKENILLFIICLIKTCSDTMPNPKYLTFLRQICSFNEQGLTSHQDILYRICENDIINNKIFLKIEIQENDLITQMNSSALSLLSGREQRMQFRKYHMHIHNQRNEREPTWQFMQGANRTITRTMTNLSVGNNLKKQETIDIDCENVDDGIKYIGYLNEQINLFAEITRGRNYLWKKKLEAFLPIKFIFQAINNKKLYKETRSAFVNLATTLCVDQEPLEFVNFPRLARVYQKNTFTITKVKTEQFLELVKNSLSYIKGKVQKIEEQFNGYSKAAEEALKKKDFDKIERLKMKKILDQILLFDIIKLLFKLLQFNLLQLLNLEQDYPIIVQNLLQLLEYDESNPAICITFIETRNKKNQQEIEEKKQQGFFQLKNLGKNIISAVADNIAGFSTVFSQTLLGSKSSKKQNLLKRS